MPLVFNDGTPVPEDLLAQTFAELRDQFGAASWETQVLRGHGSTKEPHTKRISLASSSTFPISPTSEILHRIQKKLKVCFDQLDVWITSHPMDVI